MDLITHLQCFLRVAEVGSFSAVAEERGVTQPAVSRQVSALEAYLGTRLVQRSTRAITLTEEGRRLLVSARELVDAVDGLRQAAGSWLRAPAGLVRVALPVPLGLYVSSRISALLGEYKELSIELIMRDRVGNLVEEGLDLEVRLGEIDNASVICRRIGSTTALVVASPEYLEGRSTPLHPRDLERHDCIVHRRSRPDDTFWWFKDATASDEQKHQELAVTVRGRFSADNAAALYRAALAGQGVACLSHLLVSEDIANGRLVQVLPDFKFRRQPLYITYASRRRLPHRTRAVIDFLVKLLQEDPHMKL
jgi:DNA-binding transcriptional LysR family regulator